MSVKDLQLREDKKLYPPRFVIRTRGSSAAEDSLVTFTFEGATEEIVKEIILSKGSSQVYKAKVLRQCRTSLSMNTCIRYFSLTPLPLNCLLERTCNKLCMGSSIQSLCILL